MSLERLLLAGALPALLSSVAQAAPPADGWVIWQSTREDGRNEIYRAHADGSEVTRLTQTGATRPLWSPDGRWVAYTDDVAGVYVMRPDGTEVKKLSSAGWPAFFQHDGGGLVIAEGAQYVRADADTGDKVPLFNLADFPQFAASSFIPNAMTHDNRYLLVGSNLYVSGFSGSNGSFKTDFAAMLVDLQHKDKVYYLGSGCWPFTPPEGDLVFHICGDGCVTHPDVYRMSVVDLATRASYQPEIAHPDPDWGHEYNPRVSTDNKWIVYMTSTGCHDGFGCDYEIFLHQLGTGAVERTRVTESPTFDGYPDMYVGPLWTRSSEPPLVLAPRRVTFFASASEPPAAQTVKVESTSGVVAGAVHASIDPPVSWLVADTGPDSITLQVRGEAGLTRGSQHTLVTVTVEGTPGAPMTLPIEVIADESFPAPDGGVPDASLPDGGPADAAPVAATPSSGCGCALGARPAGSGVLGLLLVLLALRRRTRS